MTQPSDRAKQHRKRLPFTFDLLASAFKFFDLSQFDELVYYTALVCGITSLMRPSEYAAANKKVSVHQSTDASYKALLVRNARLELDTVGCVSHWIMSPHEE